MAVQVSDELGIAPRELKSAALLDSQKQVLESIVRGLPLTEVLEALCRIVESQADRPVRAGILLADEAGERLWTGAAPSLPETYSQAIDGVGIAPEVGTCCAAAALRKVVITKDINTAPSWKDLKQLPLGIGLKAAWSMPILSSSGSVLGTFGTYFLECGEPTPQERQLVEVLAPTAALAIERQRLDQAARTREARNQFIVDLANVTQQLREADEIMAASARLLAEHLRVDRCAYANVENESEFVITGDYSRGVSSIVGRWPVAAFGKACVRDMLEGRPYVVVDTDTHPEITADNLAAYRATNIRSVICVPLHKDGKFTAAMAVHQTVPRKWSSEEIELVSFVVARCWEALERSRVTRTLRESEQRYRTMIEASPECVKLVDANGTLLQMNRAGLAMIEATDESRALGQNVYGLIAPEYRSAFVDLNERVCRGESGTLKFEIIGLKGTRRWMETTAVPVPSGPGAYVQLAVTRDVTNRARTERALAESRARLDYAVRLSGVGFWYCDLPFDELIWDERVKEHFFLPPDARVTIDMFYERIHPEDRELTRRAIEESITFHQHYDVIYRTVDPGTGRVKYVRALGGTAYNPQGTPIRFDGVTVDVTQQREDQEQLKQLLEREQLRTDVLRNLADVAIRIHACGSVQKVLQEMTHEARQIIGAHQALATLKVSDDWSDAVHTLSLSEKYAQSGNARSVSSGKKMYSLMRDFNQPIRLTQQELIANPTWREFSEESGLDPSARGWLAVPLISHEGVSLGVVQLADKFDGEFTQDDEAILVQLSQIASVALENVQLYQELREHDRRKDEFLATLAHELRNPLAPVRTGLELLKRGDESQKAKTHQMMERQLVHLVRMVDDLLDVSRITLGKVVLQKQRIEFRTVLNSALETTRGLIESRGHEVAVRMPQAELPLDADPTRLSQVVSNLLNNAAKYTPAGGRILISVEAVGSELTLRVSDTGIGIPKDMLARVFDMFMQVGRTVEHAQGGLGIGLTLVRRLVELHGGSIEAMSEGVGQGSMFVVRLPLASSVRNSANDSDKPKSDVLGEGLRVLIVDDNVDAADSLSMLLQISGCDTMLAHTGQEALYRAATFKPNLILLDIGLPDLSGYEVAQRLRTDPSAGTAMLVALTGWGSEEYRKRAVDVGFDRHLVKPVDMDELTRVLADAGSNATH